MPVKGHPALDPAQAGTSQARLRQELGPGMERRNLEEVEHARQWLSANQRRQGTVNQYARNSLRQMTVALLEGFPHVSFTRTCKHSQDRSKNISSRAVWHCPGHARPG